MNPGLPIKTLLMVVIEKDTAILMRKKPAGSPPYHETWYLFGCEKDLMKDDIKTLAEYLFNTFGIVVNNFLEIGQDGEIKEDHDSIKKQFVYVNFTCTYQVGEIKTPAGIEKVSWIPKDELTQYDIVPPAVLLLKKLGYLNSIQ